MIIVIEIKDNTVEMMRVLAECLRLGIEVDVSVSVIGVDRTEYKLCLLTHRKDG